jgi:hypothetical protein
MITVSPGVAGQAFSMLALAVGENTTIPMANKDKPKQFLSNPDIFYSSEFRA